MSIKNRAGSCGCCGANCPTFSSILWPEWLYYIPENVRCFVTRTTTETVTTRVLRRSRLMNTSVTPNTIVSEEATVVSNVVTGGTPVVVNEETTEMIAGRFNWTGGSNVIVGDQLTFDYSETVSSTRRRDYFLPYTNTITSITIAEQYRLAVPFVFDSTIIGELDGDNEPVAQFGFVRTLTSTRTKAGFIGGATNTLTFKGFTDEPTSSSSFDTLWSAATSLTAGFVPSGSTNISDRIPTTIGEEKWLLIFHDTNGRGGNVDSLSILLGDRSIVTNADYKPFWDRPNWQTLELKPQKISRHGYVSLFDLLGDGFFDAADNRLTVKLEVAEKDSETYTTVAEQWFERKVTFEEILPPDEFYLSQFELTLCIESDGDFGPIEYGKRSYIRRREDVSESDAEAEENMLAELLDDPETPDFSNIGPMFKWRDTIAEVALGSSETSLLEAFTDAAESETQNIYEWVELRGWRTAGDEESEEKATLKLTITIDSTDFLFREMSSSGLRNFITEQPSRCFLKPTCDIGQELTHLNWEYVSAERGPIPFNTGVETARQVACNASLEQEGKDPETINSVALMVSGYRTGAYFAQLDDDISGSGLPGGYVDTRNGESSSKSTLSEGESSYENITESTIEILTTIGDPTTLEALDGITEFEYPVVGIDEGLGIGLMFRMSGPYEGYGGYFDGWTPIAQHEIPKIDDLTSEEITLLASYLGDFEYWFKVRNQYKSLTDGEVIDRIEADKPDIYRYLVATSDLEVYLYDSPLVSGEPTKHRFVNLNPGSEITVRPETTVQDGGIFPDLEPPPATTTIEGITANLFTGDLTYYNYNGTTFEGPITVNAPDNVAYYQEQVFGPGTTATIPQQYRTRVGKLVSVPVILSKADIAFSTETDDVIEDELAAVTDLRFAQDAEILTDNTSPYIIHNAIEYDGPHELTITVRGNVLS